jgi:hypothetical protein
LGIATNNAGGAPNSSKSSYVFNYNDKLAKTIYVDAKKYFHLRAMGAEKVYTHLFSNSFTGKVIVSWQQESSSAGTSFEVGCNTQNGEYITGTYRSVYDEGRESYSMSSELFECNDIIFKAKKETAGSVSIKLNKIDVQLPS